MIEKSCAFWHLTSYPKSHVHNHNSQRCLVQGLCSFPKLTLMGTCLHVKRYSNVKRSFDLRTVALVFFLDRYRYWRSDISAFRYHRNLESIVHPISNPDAIYRCIISKLTTLDLGTRCHSRTFLHNAAGATIADEQCARVAWP